MNTTARPLAPINVQVGAAVTRAIDSARVSRTCVAERLGLSPYRLRRCLRGEASFTTDDIAHLAELLDVDAWKLLSGLVTEEIPEPNVADMVRDLEVIGVDIRELDDEDLASQPHACLTWFLRDGHYLAEINPTSDAKTVAPALDHIYNTVATGGRGIAWHIAPDMDEPTAHFCWVDTIA